ncbi:CBS domain-containing protein [Candidatus Woesearchaeota archaeon]|nr:CBS domain-containing protein [Candidatus Woesearchaeota archaeon]
MIDNTKYILENIKKMRVKYELNQKELAKKAGVSQSLIAKIEAGKIDPTYSRVKQIFTALENLENKEELKARDIVNKQVMFAQSNDILRDVIKIMKNKGISQIPVLCKEKIVGLITEGIILEKIVYNPERINNYKVSEVMEEAPPIVSLNTGIKTLSALLRDNAIVLAAEKGEIKGIISKADLLGRME